MDTEGVVPSQRRTGANYLPLLDANHLNHHNGLSPGQSYLLAWGEPVWASVSVVATECCLEAIYTVLGESEARRECFSFEWSPCHFGGNRPLLVCPGCDKGFYRLYLKDSLFRCQSCHHLKNLHEPGESKEKRRQRNRERLGQILRDVPGKKPRFAPVWAEVPEQNGIDIAEVQKACVQLLGDISPRVRDREHAAKNPAQKGKGGRPQVDILEIPCTCGRGEGLDGHKTTCHRGRVLWQRQRRQEKKPATLS